MSSKTIFTCDRCKAEFITKGERPGQFWHVAVLANTYGYTDPSKEVRSLEVCRPCLESMGIHVTPNPKPDEPQPVPPTIEELIREIVSRCTEQNQ